MGMLWRSMTDRPNYTPGTSPESIIKKKKNSECDINTFLLQLCQSDISKALFIIFKPPKMNITCNWKRK